MNITKRSLVKGLFFSAALPLVPYKSLIQNTRDLIKSEIYLVDGFFGSRQLISLNQAKGPILSIVKYSVESVNKFAKVEPASYARHLIIEDVDKLLKPLKEKRTLYDYLLISDESNNPDLKDNPDRKFLTCRVQSLQILYYEFNIVYDPRMVI